MIGHEIGSSVTPTPIATIDSPSATMRISPCRSAKWRPSGTASRARRSGRCRRSPPPARAPQSSVCVQPSNCEATSSSAVPAEHRRREPDAAVRRRPGSPPDDDPEQRPGAARGRAKYAQRDARPGRAARRAGRRTPPGWRARARTSPPSRPASPPRMEPSSALTTLHSQAYPIQLHQSRPISSTPRSTPCQVRSCGHQRGDLGQCEHEHQVEEQLQRRDRLVLTGFRCPDGLSRRHAAHPATRSGCRLERVLMGEGVGSRLVRVRREPTVF